MKRMICMALALMLCLCLVAMPAFSAGTGASLTGPGTVRAGDTIVLTLQLNGEKILGVTGTLAYDASQLELKQTKVLAGDSWTAEFNGNRFVAYDNYLDTPLGENTPLMELTFLVKNGMAVGATIEVSCTDIVGSNGSDDIDLGSASYSVKIAAPIPPTEPVQPTTPSVPPSKPDKEPTQPTTAAPTEPTTVAPTEPTTVAPTQPSTAAPTEPTQPTAAPTQPQQPGQQQESGGIQLWVLILACGLCLIAGAAVGILVDRKFLNKK